MNSFDGAKSEAHLGLRLLARTSPYQAVLGIALLLLALSVQPSAFFESPPLPATVNTDFREGAIEYRYIYPNASLSEVPNASMLADRIFSGFGETIGGERDVDPTLFYGPVNLIFRAPPFEDPFDGFIQGYQVLGFSSNNGSLLRLYYSNAPDSHGWFLAFIANFTDSDISARDSSEYESVARDAAGSLGIPIENLSIVDYIYGSSFDYSFGKNTTTLILSEKVLGYPLTGCNLVAATFDNYTKRLIAFQARPYVSVPTTLDLSLESALTIGKNTALVEKEKTDDTFKSDRIAGIRLVPIAIASDPQLLPDDASNYTYSVSIDIRFGFEYIADIIDSMYDPVTYSVLVAVDVESGAVLFTCSTGGPYSNDGSIVLSSWSAWVVAAAVVSLITAAVIALSPESALIIAQSLIIPVYTRMRGSTVLDSFNRGRIYGVISSQPGCSFSDLKSALGIGNGTLAYHLMVLERLELVKSARGGKIRRYYPIGVGDPVKRGQCLGKTEARVLNELISNGPKSTSGLATELSISRQRAHYNVKLLLKRGLVTCENSVWRAESAPIEEGPI